MYANFCNLVGCVLLSWGMFQNVLNFFWWFKKV